MILIFSVSNDQTTFEVIRWLNHLGEAAILRINSDEQNDIIYEVQDSDFSLQVNGVPITLKDIGAVWYRKGGDWLGGQFLPVSVSGHPGLTSYLNNSGIRENRKLSEYLHYLIEQTVPVLGSAFNSNPNKLMMLNLAREAGLKTPESRVLNAKPSVLKLLEDGEPRYITKSMSDGVYLFESQGAMQGYFSFTESLSEDSLDGYPEKISPSFLQRKIEKRYELRVFYLDGNFFAWAIISQSSAQTSTDYRKYDSERPNRMVPYALPKSVENKLANVFCKMGLNTGSVDLMVDAENEYYFLEINPAGQFGAMSTMTNYQLESEVAKWLMEHAKAR